MSSTPYSAVGDIIWPAIQATYAAELFALLFQHEQTQWWSPEEIEKQQFRQLALVVAHAQATVPFYQQRFAAAHFDKAQLL